MLPRRTWGINPISYMFNTCTTMLLTEERALFQAPTAPKTTMDALSQRLDKYKNAEQQAKEEGNMSKSRRMGRITKVGRRCAIPLV